VSLISVFWLACISLCTQGTHFFGVLKNCHELLVMAFYAVGLYWYGNRLLNFSMNGLWKQFYLDTGD